MNDDMRYEEDEFDVLMLMESNHSVNEFVYTFQKMGVSLTLPKVNGLFNYRSARTDHALLKITKDKVVKAFYTYFQLPDFANMPEIYLRSVTASLQIIFKDCDFSLTQTYFSVNGRFSYLAQNYVISILRKAFENGQIPVLEETKIFPEGSRYLPVRDSLESFAKFIQISPHSEVLPSDA